MGEEVGRQQAMLHGEQRRAGAGGDAGLGVDVLDVMPDRLGGDSQRGGHLLVQLTAGDQPQHLDLAVGEPRWRARPLCDGLPGGGEHGVDLEASEVAGIDLVEQLRGGCGRRERRTVGPVLGHGVIGVGGGQQTSTDVELVTRRTAVVARAVDAFVVAAATSANGASSAQRFSTRSLR